MTDFGNKDYSVAAVKGAILSTVENPQIVDISTKYPPTIPLKQLTSSKMPTKFPKGSIHIIGVESEKTPENEHLAMYFDGHYFIGADNGIFAMIKGDLKSDKTVLINIHDKMPSTYPVLEIFVWVAAHISRKGTLEVVGKTVDQIKEIKELRPVINKQEIKSLELSFMWTIMAMWSLTSPENYSRKSENQELLPFLQEMSNSELYTKPTATPLIFYPQRKREEDGKKIALFNDADHLELAIYKSNTQTVGSAQSLFGLEYRESITIKFE